MNNLPVPTQPSISGQGVHSRFRQIDECSIRKLVVSFYCNVRDDPTLGLILECSLVTRDGNGQERFRVLQDFWSSVLLAEGERYNADPLAIDLAIPDLVPAMFERWLTIFHLTCSKVFDADVAAGVADRAERIARALNAAIARRRS